MPEGLEAEIWRRACEPLVGRRIVDVEADPRVSPPQIAVLRGARVVGVRRRGKVVVIDTDAGALGLHFAMTGRLVVDGSAPIERLAYSSARDDAAWDRLRLWTDLVSVSAGPEVPAVRFNDPRRLGSISLGADLERLGVDFSAVTARRLGVALEGRRAAVKVALLDQTVVAGLGNLCADEVLWWAAVDPHRRTDRLDAGDVERLADAIRRRLPVMLRRGGSTTGVLDPGVRASCPPCERDGAPLRRDRIAGRTAVWCPGHQR